MEIFLALILFASSVLSVSATPCQQKVADGGIVCLCTENYCDTLDSIDLNQQNDFVLVSTSLGGLRFNVVRATIQSQNVYMGSFTTIYGVNIIATLLSIINSLFEVNAKVTVTRSTTYQKNIGFGGAFTGSVSYIIEMLPKSLQDHIYKSYFSQTEGIGYNLCRIPIGGSDFDLAPWAYNEQPKYDMYLSNFTTLDDRDLQRLSQLNDLKNATGNYNIKYIGAAWSSPPWMKTNESWTGLSSLKPKYYDTWAQYHLKYLELMAEQNATFWAFSTGNEPLNGNVAFPFVRFMSLGWTPGTQAKWVAEYLGPLIRNSSMRDVKILAGDDQRYIFPGWFQEMALLYPTSIDYVDGFAKHWYWDDIAPPSFLDATHAIFPNKFIINTESCIGDKPLTESQPVLGSWDRAEQYATSYIEDLTHWGAGWVDWNLVLDETGGPNYVQNTVDAPIIVNTTNKSEFYKQPMFYIIGHLSRFIVEDSIRIDVKSTHLSVVTLGYRRPDNSIVIVLFNKSTKNANINLKDGIINIKLNLPPRSIHTLVYY